MKNYVVIGGSSGIGKALAERLANEGHRVFGTYYQHETAGWGQLSFHPLNVLDEHLQLDFLPDQLDGLAYCPGTINLMPFHRIKPDDFLSDYQLQVIGAVKVLQAALPKLKKSGNASVVLFSTVAVQHGFNFHTQVSASKGALEGLTKALAAELAPTVRVNAIAPSITDTPLAGRLLNTDEKKHANAQRHPLKRVGQPEDIAAMASFLLGDHGNWITGQILTVDGGISALKV